MGQKPGTCLLPKKLIITFLFATLVHTMVVHGQSAYALDAKGDALLGGLALGVCVPSLFVGTVAGDQKPLGNINAIDLFALRPYNRFIDTLSTGTAMVSLTLPAISVIEQWRDYPSIATYASMYAEAFLLTAGTKDLIKVAVPRHRPYTYFKDKPEDDADDELNSFPSGHTAYAFLGATFVATTFCREYPLSRWKVPVAVSAYAFACVTGVFRIVSGNHFITDVLAGAVIGSLYGFLVPYAHDQARTGT